MKLWLRLGLMAGLSAFAVAGYDWNTLRPQGYVSDFARVIDPASRARLETYCAQIEQSAGARIALVTLPSLAGEPVGEVAAAISRNWAVGQKSPRGGVVLVMAVRERRARLATSRGLDSILSDRAVLSEMRPALRENDFAEAATAAAETIGLALTQPRKTSMVATLKRRLRPGLIDWFLWPVLAGAILLVLGLTRLGGVRGDGSGGKGGLLPWLLGGRRTARFTWGANGSGGFGGYDSGDGGFGGFGGGDSPGLRASDW